MKNFYLVIVFLICSISILFSQENEFNISENTSRKITFENTINVINFHEEILDSKNFVSIDLGNEYLPSSQVGAPQLPFISYFLEVPEEANIQINIINKKKKISDLKSLHIDYPIIPVQEKLLKTASTFNFIQDMDIYGENSFFGLDEISVEEIGFLQGRRLAKLKISPIKYNPASQEIEVYEYIKAEIVFNNANIKKTNEKRLKTNQVFNSVLDNKLINSKNFNPYHSELPKHPYKYVVVSSHSFESTLQPFLQWKKEKGFNVVEVYIEDIENGNTPEGIRTHLKRIYETATVDDPAPTFLLIAGSNRIIQAFQRSVIPYGLYNVVGNKNSPTDLYFAEYTDDIYPEVFYGRFPADNAQELGNMINKTIEYEKFQLTDKSYLDNVLLVSGNENRVAIVPTLTNGPLNYLKNTYFSESPKVNTSIFYNSNTLVPKKDVLEKIAKNNSFLYYTGHCTITSWQLGGSNYIFADDIISTTGLSRRYFLSINNCCLSNKYDLSSGRCFGEDLIKSSQSGAIGIIGASNETFWDDDYYWSVGAKNISENPSYGGTLGAFDRFFHTHNESLNDQYITQGQLMTAGNLSVTQSGSIYEKYYWEIYCLFGDPSLMPYIGIPSSLEIQVPQSVEKGTSSLRISGTPFTYVSLMDNTTLIGAGLINENGYLDVDFFYPIINDNSLKLTATKQFYEPYFNEISISSPENSKMVFVDYIMKDSENYQIDKLQGEGEYQLILQLKNVGQQSSSGKLSISCVDTNIVFQNTEYEWADILPGNIVSNDNIPFIFYAKNFPNRKIEFKINIAENNNIAENYFKIDALAPELEFGMIKVINDWKNEPGKVNLQIELFNKGRDNAIDVKLYPVVDSMPENITLDQDIYLINDISPLNSGSTNIELNFSDQSQSELSFVIEVSYNGNKILKRIEIPLQRRMDGFETNSFSLFHWDNSSLSPWVIETNKKNVYEGNYSARSGKIKDGERSILLINLNVLENDYIHFYYKVSSEDTGDFLTFRINGEIKGEWDGEIPWTKASFPISSGYHTLIWQYSKDISITKGEDCAWLDNVELPLSSDIVSIGREILAEEPAIYPNPSRGIVFLDLLIGSEKYELYVYNSFGKLLKKQQLTQSNERIDLSNFSDGVYLFVIKGYGKQWIKKVILAK